MLCNGRVGTDAVLVHERDEVCLCEHVGGRCAALLFGDGVRTERLAFVVLRQEVACPLVVGEDVEVVALMHDEAARAKDFLADFDVDVRLLAGGVLGAAAEEATRDVLVDALLIA